MRETIFYNQELHVEEGDEKKFPKNRLQEKMNSIPFRKIYAVEKDKSLSRY